MRVDPPGPCADKASRRRLVLWWSLAVGYLGLTYATLGRMPQYWRALNDSLGGNGLMLQYAVYTGAGAGILALLYRDGFLHIRRNVGVTIAFILAFAAMFYFQKNPGEKIHMLQYGVFGWLVYRALSLHFARDSRALYMVGGLVALVAGAVDEIIQGMLPNRYFTLHDVIINGLSGVMVLGFIRYYFRSRRREHT